MEHTGRDSHSTMSRAPFSLPFRCFLGKYRRSKAVPLTWETVRKLALALPEVEEGMSYGTAAFRVRGKLFARLHQDGDSVVVRIDRGERAMRLRADPEAFYITDHYVNYPWMLVRMAAVRRADLRDLLEEAWRLSAPQRLVVAFDKG
jgi:hypothetical protein